MLNELKKKSMEWEDSNFSHYVVESLTEKQKGFIRHPQKQIIINDSILCLFLMIAAFHHGGNWYYWFNLNRNNNKTIKALINSLAISYQRVQLRILFTLQFFPEYEILKHIDNPKIILSSDIISKIKNYVLKRSVLLLFNEFEKNSDEALKSKVKSVLREINQYWPSDELRKIKRDMNYKIFISFSKFDIKIAETIASSINNYFRGAVKVFYAPKDIKVGSKWKETILKALKEYDAIISLISQSTYDKPWIIAEFTAFWLQSKDIYILKYGDLDYNKAFQIFSDYQICNLQNKEDILDLIEVLATKTKIPFAPFDKAQEILDQINLSIDDTLKNRSLTLNINSKQIEVKRHELSAIAEQIPKDVKMSKILTAKKIKQIAREIGLFTRWNVNTQLTYNDGDISWYFQQNYNRLKIESDFRAKYLILSIAENEKQIIPSQGDLSAIAQGLSGEIERLWEKSSKA